MPQELASLVIAVLLALISCVPACGDDAALTYTDPAAADADFALQGEYFGVQSLSGDARGGDAVGLQVIALGKGEFQAWKYYGGLPGRGWDREERHELTGQLRGSTVELTGSEYDILADGITARLFTHDGRPAGTLQKLERVSPTLGAPPPPHAIVLFDGSSTAEFTAGKVTPAGWLLAGADTTRKFRNFRLHGEFRLPYKPLARGQDRGNSGFYLQTRYEVQVLDSFGLEGIENECGALYRTRRPDLNMCLPPLQWQTYDIDFTAARFDDAGRKVGDMRISVWHNGVLIHHGVSIPDKTGAGQSESPDPLPIRLQEHGNPVVYRNLWIVETDGEQAGPGELPIPLSGTPTPVSLRPPYPYPIATGTLTPSFGTGNELSW
jgi:hypothetical protein